MRIRITRSLAGPRVFRKGEELLVGEEIPKQQALRFLNSGLAVAIADANAETAEYPVHKGGGYYQLSDGSQVRGKDAAVAAEKAL